MITVHKTGSVVRIPLLSERLKPEAEQAALLLKVLDFDEFRRVLHAVDGLGSNFEQGLERVRKVLGSALVGLENWKIADEATREVKDFQLERAGSEITKASMSVLAPWIDEILDSIKKAFTFGLSDAKNSQ